MTFYCLWAPWFLRRSQLLILSLFRFMWWVTLLLLLSWEMQELSYGVYRCGYPCVCATSFIEQGSSDVLVCILLPWWGGGALEEKDGIRPQFLQFWLCPRGALILYHSSPFSHLLLNDFAFGDLSDRIYFIWSSVSEILNSAWVCSNCSGETLRQFGRELC